MNNNPMNDLVTWLTEKAKEAKKNSLDGEPSKTKYYMYAGECSAYCETLREIHRITTKMNEK